MSYAFSRLLCPKMKLRTSLKLFQIIYVVVSWKYLIRLDQSQFASISATNRLISLDLTKNEGGQ